MFVAGGPKRYHPNTTVPQHHLTCVDRGEFRDVNPPGVDDRRLLSPERHGFEILDVQVLFRGRCPNCCGI
ncbi:MAG: hypothetical protein M3O70_11430 [Actinomycetota bacterium]|nr:hypothetical protein [Actinomycetota bacterium]